jgi:hypothetical protein
VTRVLFDGAAALFTRDGGKLRVRPAKRVAKGARFTVEVGYRGRPAAMTTRPPPTRTRSSSAG